MAEIFKQIARMATHCLAAFVFSTASWVVAAPDVFTNVPEATAEGYQLVYTLPIENSAGYNLTGAVPWSVDNSAAIVEPFDRIAYYLELDDSNGLVFVYVSMDAFTSDVIQTGLPILANGVVFQQNVASMNVVSNSAAVTPGTGITTGNIEFWPYNYGTQNAGGVPGADPAIYDFGDASAGSGDYGSFQIHNHGSGETLLAYNQWGGVNTSVDSDLGIGNSAVNEHTDWTFAFNARNYVVKNLQILVRPSLLSIDRNLDRAVFQRNALDQADVPVTGAIVAGATRIEARATPRPGNSGTATGWQTIVTNPQPGNYAGSLTLDAGWYDIEVRSVDGTGVLAQRTAERVGVGEVFVIAGQSNSANHGSDLLFPVEERVSAFDLHAWRIAADPQPIATGAGGSSWPELGDLLSQQLDLPVGFVSVGWGGTTVGQWVPGAAGPAARPLYDRLRDALQALGPGGARAVLWHQGESDNLFNTTTADYVQRLESIIDQSRIDAGFDIPWGIAGASFVPPSNIDQNILDAQEIVANNDPLNFIGAFTDDLVGPVWRAPDEIHFNGVGLREKAARWRDAINAHFFPPVQVVGDSWNLNQGILFSGSVDSLVSSDDKRLWIVRNPLQVQSVTEFEVIATSPTLNPRSLSIRLEAMTFSRSAINQALEVFNFSTGQFEVIDIRKAQPFSDSIVEVELAGDLTRFIEPATGRIESRINFTSINARQQFASGCDVVLWLIGE
ncbi:MAG: sialate O-acetylesterase [Planctomycetota bacterium]